MTSAPRGSRSLRKKRMPWLQVTFWRTFLSPKRNEIRAHFKPQRSSKAKTERLEEKVICGHLDVYSLRFFHSPLGVQTKSQVSQTHYVNGTPTSPIKLLLIIS